MTLPGVGLDLDGDGHARGERDAGPVDRHGVAVESDGDGEDEGLGLAGGGGGLLRRVGGGGRVGERALGLLLGDGARRDLDHPAVDDAEPGERERVDLDHRRLPELDEADVDVGHQRLDLKLAVRGRDHRELLAGRDHLADRRHRRLLHHAVDRGDEARALKARRRLGERLARLVPLARGVGELVLVVGDELRYGLHPLALELQQGRVGFDQLALVGGEQRLRLLQLLLGVIEVDLGADVEVDRLLPGVDPLLERLHQRVLEGDAHVEPLRASFCAICRSRP